MAAKKRNAKRTTTKATKTISKGRSMKTARKPATTRAVKGKQRKGKKNTPKTVAPSYRVWKLTPGEKQAFQDLRERRELTVKVAASLAIVNALPELVAELTKTGIKHTSPRKPIRIPHDEQDLAELRRASQETGLDQTLLFRVALMRLAAKS